MEREGKPRLSAKENTQIVYSQLMDKVEAIPGEERPYIKFGRIGKDIDLRILLLKYPAGGPFQHQYIAISANGIMEVTGGKVSLVGHSSIEDCSYETLDRVMPRFMDWAERKPFDRVGWVSFGRYISREDDGSMRLKLIEKRSNPDQGEITLRENPYIDLKTLKKALKRSIAARKAKETESPKQMSESRKRDKARKLKQYLSELTELDGPRTPGRTFLNEPL